MPEESAWLLLRGIGAHRHETLANLGPRLWNSTFMFGGDPSGGGRELCSGGVAAFPGG
jgi:hypothetical protein